MTLQLTENRGFGFAEINKLVPDLSIEGEAFRLNKILILKILKTLTLLVYPQNYLFKGLERQ